jgi:hypothetical protein
LGAFIQRCREDEDEENKVDADNTPFADKIAFTQFAIRAESHTDPKWRVSNGAFASFGILLLYSTTVVLTTGVCSLFMQLPQRHSSRTVGRAGVLPGSSNIGFV